MNKSFKVFSLSILFLVVAMSMVSADVDFLDNSDVVITNLSDTAVQGEIASYSFKIQEGNYGDMTDITFTSPITLTGTSSSFDATLTITNAPTELDEDEISNLITVTFDVPLSQEIGDYTSEIEVIGEYASTSTSTLPITLTITQAPIPEEITACSATGNPDGDLIVEIDDISVEGFGDDEEWLPLDEIEVEINIENDNDDYDIEDIELSWGLYNKDTGKWYIDDEENDFDLKDGDEKTITLTFKLDDDVDELGDGDYVFYVWANGNLDDDSSSGVDLCASDSKSIDLIIEDDFVVLNDIQVSETASCGSEVQITADVWNLGDDDQDDVYVVIYNKELGINEKVTIGDIDALEDEKLDVTITLPENAEEKQYDLVFRVYDDDGEVYENDYDDDKAEFFMPITLDSCSTVPLVSVSASLESDAKAGEELIVKANVINTGSKTATYSFNVAGYADWASLGSIDKTSLTLNAGESTEVLIKLNVNSDASGDKSFNIELVEGNKILTQQVSVLGIGSQSALPSLTGLFSGMGGDNWYLYGIGALNVLLVLVIIIVAVRVSKKKE